MPEEALIDETSQVVNQNKKLVFNHFPAFARFIRDHHIIPYIQEQLRISREIKLPMLKFFESIPDDELILMSVNSHKDFLTYVEENRLQEQIEVSLRLWVSNQLGVMDREEIAAEDITLSSYMRKEAMLKFIPSYTNDIQLAIALIKEIDAYTVEIDTAATNTYIDLLKERIHDQVRFIEVISDTMPGLTYVYNFDKAQITFANKTFKDFFGYIQNDWEKMGTEALIYLVHPDDIKNIDIGLKQFEKNIDKEVISWEYRVKNKNDEYVWMRNYASALKRDSENKTVEIIGIILDISNEKQIQEKLSRSEEQLLEAQALAEIGSYEWDVETDDLFVTPQFLKIYEVPHIRKRKDILPRIQPDDLKQHTIKIQEALEKTGKFDSEYRYIVHGKEKILWNRASVTILNGKKILKGTVMDVTQRHQMLQQLKDSEQLNKQAQAISHIGNWAWDIYNNKYTWSEELYRIYDMEPQTGYFPSETSKIYRHPDDSANVEHLLQHSLKTRSPFDAQYRIITLKGNLKYLHARGEMSFDDKGNVIKMLGTVQDITPQKQIEKQLKDYQEFIKKITDTAPSIISLYHVQNGDYSFINLALEKLLGYNTGEALTHSDKFFNSIVHPDDLAGLQEKTGKMLEAANEQLLDEGDEPIAEYKYRMRHKNGTYKWFHTYSTIFERDTSGRASQVLNISVDVTEQEEAEQALFRKNMELEQSNASLGEYAYVASHDLKEPLRKISTFSDRLLGMQHENISAEGRLYLEKIMLSARRMQAMINDLLSISMLSGNKPFESCNLRQVFEDVIQTLEYKIEEKNAIVEAGDLPAIQAIPSQFRQLFQNLISNSLKFVKENLQPKITITHTFLSPQQVTGYNLIKAKKYLKLTFSDNGIGFDNQYANKIFTIFQRLHGKADYEGNGIGLSICKKIVENHSGVIFANGVMNKGANFTIIIPV